MSSPKFEIIQGGKDHNAPHKKSKANLSVIEGGSLERKSDGFAVEIVKEAKIEQRRFFKKEEIVEVISNLAKKELVEHDDLIIKKEVYDQMGNLLILEIEVHSDKAKKLGWGNILYVFTIKGKYTSSSGRKQGTVFSDEGSIMRFNFFVNEPDKAVAGAIVGTYNEEKNKWEETKYVGKYADSAIDISSLE